MIYKFNKFNFLNENAELSQWGNLQGMPNNPLGPGFGFASDPNASVYSDGNNPYIDNYARTSGLIADLTKVMKGLSAQGIFGDYNRNIDSFLEEVDSYKNLKILRIFKNTTGYIDVFISFEFMEEEFFGVYRSFNNPLGKTKLESDLLSDPRMSQIDKDYYLKLNNYFYKILENWFIPKKGLYKNLKEDNEVKDEMGQIIKLRKNSVIDVIGTNIDKDNNPYIILKIKDKKYTIGKNNYFFFKYWFSKH